MTLETSQRLAVVTGATRGLGWASAVTLAEAGYHIVGLGRTVGALEELDDLILKQTGQRATLVPADLQEHDTIDRLGALLYDRFGRVDALVMAAGLLGGLSPVGHFTPKTWSQVMDVNLTANYRLIRSLDPLLRQSQAGRVVAFSSGITQRPRAYWGAYAASKAGLEAMIRCYADEMISTPVRANLLNPGPMATTMRKQAFPGENQDTLPAPETIGPLVLEMCSPEFTGTGDLINFKDWAVETA